MNVFRKIEALLLAVIFLTSTLGFAANKMICIKSGKTIISFTPVKECCPAKDLTKTAIQKKCCNVYNSTFSLINFQHSPKIGIEPFFMVNSFFYHSQISIETARTTQLASFLSSTDIAPPTYGRKLLSLISVLCI